MGSSRHDWVCFQRLEDGDMYFHACNLHYREKFEKKWPALVIFGIAFGGGKDGLPTAKEYAGAVKVEDALRASMERAGHGVHIATVTGAGGRMWIFQCKSARATDLRFAKLPPKLRGAVSCQHADDPDWTLYNESLLPNEREELEHDFRVLVQELERDGDNPNRSRPIEHTACFQTEAARKKFCGWVKKKEFKLDSTPEPDKSDEFPFAVHFSRKSRPHAELIAEQGYAALVAARKLSGRYDGWQTVLVKTK